MAITTAFDSASEEILKPSLFIPKIDGFPETVVVTFEQKMLNALREISPAEIIGNMFAGVKIPIYKTKYKGKPIAYYMSAVGGPTAVALLEEILAMGAKSILLFGSCGSLKKDIAGGHIVVPDAAYRDEGTSYHYVAAGEGDFITVKTAPRLLKILGELNVSAIRGKTWTTDAIYRETRANMESRKKAGCIAVEMECASVMAFAQFRNVDVYQFLYTADNLDASEWEPRILINMPDDVREKYARLAFEVAAKL